MCNNCLQCPLKTGWVFWFSPLYEFARWHGTFSNFAVSRKIYSFHHGTSLYTTAQTRASICCYSSRSISSSYIRLGYVYICQFVLALQGMYWHFLYYSLNLLRVETIPGNVRFSPCSGQIWQKFFISFSSLSVGQFGTVTHRRTYFNRKLSSLPSSVTFLLYSTCLVLTTDGKLTNNIQLLVLWFHWKEITI